ncbi:MAG: KEOPS complex N(6)-L-threonylcarbamoyladenine synthase Kae1 [Nanoarchaeota archaeon]
MILGIESTAHTFGVGIVHKGKVLANVKEMYRPDFGGIIPIKSAEHHKNVAQKIYRDALNRAGISEKEIEVIAFSNAPGLAPCLLAGMNFARDKAKELNLNLIEVNHCIAHLEIGRNEGAKDPVLLYCSGANTQIIAFASGKYRVFGETLDTGIGNFIDKFARELNISFPGGPEIEKLAKTGNYIELPYVVKGMDVSFSGIYTKLLQLYKSGVRKEDLSFSLQETAFAMLVEAAERAIAHTGKKELVLGGGVACNLRLQEMCKIMCKERGVRFFCPAREFLVDNGGMIAYTGELMYLKNKKKAVESDKVDIKPRQRTDDVNVDWR